MTKPPAPSEVPVLLSGPRRTFIMMERPIIRAGWEKRAPCVCVPTKDRMAPLSLARARTPAISISKRQRRKISRRRLCRCAILAALILRCDPGLDPGSLEGRNPADAAPDRRCVLRGRRFAAAPQHEESCEPPADPSYMRVRADDGSYGALRLARTATRTPAMSSSKRPLSSHAASIAPSGDDT